LHHTIGIAVAPMATGEVLEGLKALDGVVQLSVERGVSVKPSGDLITAHVLNRDVDAVLAIADSAREHGSVSVTTAEAQSMVDEHSARAIDDDVDEAPWEEIERGLRHHGRFNWNFAALMALGSAIALAGLVSAPVVQALGLAAAGIIAPAFEPMAKLTVGIVRRSWYGMRRALIAVVAGYLVMAAAGALVYLLLHAVGMANPEVLAASEGVKTVVHPTAADWLLSACGAIAGVVIFTAFRQAVIAGALIALALVPATALVGAGLAAGDLGMTLEALRRVLLDAALVVVLGGVVLVLKQRLVHHNRPPMM
jgi:Domain of unknown function (DUF389)